jgi:hypothetical protein
MEAENTQLLTRPSIPELALQGLRRLTLAAALLLPVVSHGGVLSQADLQKVDALKPLFANLMSDLAQSARRPDASPGDVNCINATIQEFLQISDELASYEYLIAMDKDIKAFDEKNPMRDLVKFAADKSSAILTGERKRLVQLSEQCARFPMGLSKTQQALQVIDATSGILIAIRDRL